MDRKDLFNLLSDYDKRKVEVFVNYCIRLDNEKKDNTLSNPWMQYTSNQKLSEMFKRVASQGLDFDGIHVTLLSTGISYDYVAYKNKMLMVYPETIMDMQLVYNEDQFSFNKESGKVFYKHVIGNPFSQKSENVVGAYCVIKNRRGEFLTTMSKEDIEKHKKAAKTKFIWEQWAKEMYIKTIVKKGVKVHFDDVYTEMLEDEKDETDLSPEPIKNYESLTEIQNRVLNCKTVEDLKTYYESIPVKTKAINEFVLAKKQELEKNGSTI